MDIVSDPAVVGDIVVVRAAENNIPATEAQRIIGLNRVDGAELWKREAGTLQSLVTPTTDGRLIYAFGEPCTNVPCSRSYPMALNPADGSIVWTNDDVTIDQGISPVVVAGHLLYDDISTVSGGNVERGVASLNSADGSIDWISIGGHSFFSLTAIINGVAVRSSNHPTVVSDR